jgi:hypothetical protein
LTRYLIRDLPGIKVKGEETLQPSINLDILIATAPTYEVRFVDVHALMHTIQFMLATAGLKGNFL